MRVFITFLGKNTYTETTYEGWGRRSSPTPFSPVAALELLGADRFDRVVVLVTPEAEAMNGQALRAGLSAIVSEGKIHRKSISAGLTSAADHWKTFEQVLDVVEDGDTLVVDTTSGFRSLPTIVASALGYVQRVKSVRIEHVLYGEYRNPGPSVFVDMREFFVVQSWADAVSRLVDSADARMLADLSTSASPDSTFARLANPELTRAFLDLTDVLRNVDVHRVSGATSDALQAIERSIENVTPAEQQLLQLVRRKFSSLVSAEPPGGRYDRGYLGVQVAVSRVLVEHELLMQALTVMRELIGSIGMFGLRGTPKDLLTTTGEGRKQRKHADVFLRMLQNPEAKWQFSEDESSKLERLRPWMTTIGPTAWDSLGRLAFDVTTLRNGFDHGWTGTAKVPADLPAQAESLIARVAAAVDALPDPPARAAET